MRPSLLIGFTLLAGAVSAADLPVGVVARTPAHAVRFSPKRSLYLAPDGKSISDGTTWIDLATETACAPPLELPKPDEGRGFELLDTGDVAVWGRGKAALLDGQTGKEKAAFATDNLCAFDATGRRVMRTVGAKNAGKTFTAVEVATWPKPGEEPAWVTLATEDGQVYVEAFSRSGSHLYWEVYVGGGTNRAFRVHDFATGATATLEGETNDYALSRSGKLAGGQGRDAVLVCDTATGKLARSFPLSAAEKERYYTSTCEFTPDERHLIVWNLNYNRLDLFPTDPKDDRRGIDLAPGHGVQAVHLTPDGKRAVVQDETGVIRVYDLAAGKPVGREKDRPTWAGVRWLADGSLLTWSHNGMAGVWDADTLKRKRAFTLGPLSAEHWGARVELSPDRTRLVVDEQPPEKSDTHGHRFRILDATTGKKLLALLDTLKAPRCAFHPDGRSVWVPTYDTKPKEEGGAGDHLRAYDVTTGEYRVTDRLLPDYPFGFCSDGRSVLVRYWRDREQSVKWVDVRTRDTRWEAELKPAKEGSGRIDGSETRFADDPKAGTAVVVLNGRVAVYDLLTGNDRTPPGLEFDGCALTPDARWVFGVKGWDDGSPVLSLTDLRAKPGEKGDREFADVPLEVWPISLAVSPDAKRAATLADDGTLTVWDLDKLRTVPPKVAKAIDPWAVLLTDDHAAAMRALHADPAAALKLFAEKVRPVAVPDAKVVARRIGELSSPDFKTRDAAEKWLGEVCDAIRPALLAAAAKATSAEAGERIARLLEKAETAADQPEFTRTVRAVEVVERIGTPEAVKLLERCAGGAPGAALTTEAADSLKRLNAGK